MIYFYENTNTAALYIYILLTCIYKWQVFLLIGRQQQVEEKEPEQFSRDKAGKQI